MRTYSRYDGEQLVAALSPAGTVTTLHLWGPDGLLARGDTFYLFDPPNYPQA